MKISKIIPTLTITNWLAFANQPANDGIEVISDSANDTGYCTIWGIDGTGILSYETITLNGTTAVSTIKTNWTYIYAVFLGKSGGSNIKRAVGTVTIREASGNLAITTIAAGNFNSGMLILNIPGCVYEFENTTGITYRSTFEVPATSLTGIKETGRAYVQGLCDKFPLSIISDNTGATVQVTVYTELGQLPKKNSDTILSSAVDSIDIAKISKGSYLNAATTGISAVTATTTSNEINASGYNTVLIEASISVAVKNWTFKIQGCFVSAGTFIDILDMSYQTNVSKIFMFKGIPDYIKIVATEDEDGATVSVKAQLLNT